MCFDVDADKLGRALKLIAHGLWCWQTLNTLTEFAEIWQAPFGRQQRSTCIGRELCTLLWWCIHGGAKETSVSLAWGRPLKPEENSMRFDTDAL